MLGERDSLRTGTRSFDYLIYDVEANAEFLMLESVVFLDPFVILELVYTLVELSPLDELLILE